MTTERDNTFLRTALELARQYEGQTAPNPPVGALCVDASGVVIGSGAHQKAGTPHAEVHALSSCTRDPAGATLYVTLEPCSTTGRTPPCCERIIHDQLKRVVIGCIDPNPRHAGRAVERLRSAGIQVDIAEGEIAKACQDFIAPFAKAITTSLPFLQLKLAMTLDGYLADAHGASRWVSGEEARQWTQQLRKRVDAVMVGSGTVRADHPSLQPHLPDAPLKRRILVNRVAPIDSADVDAHTWIATRDLGYDGKDLHALLRTICARGVNHILCEGGGRLAGALLEAGLVDELDLIYAPKILGDPNGVRGLPITPRVLAQAEPLTLLKRCALGEDTLLRLKPQRKASL